MQTAGVAKTALTAPPHQWSAPTRAAFRFAVVYFGLTILFSQLFSAVFMLPSPRYLTGVNDLVAAVGTHVFRVDGPISVEFSGSGDRLIDWVFTATLLLVALVATAVWSLTSRSQSYPRLNRWFRLLVRFVLGASMVRYGFGKLLPTQMPTVFLTRLVEPFGDFSPMGVLWTSMGAAPAYESFTGAVELLAGILLFIPQTTLLGALIALAAATQVFVLNMTYDVPAKLLSFHLLLLSLVLLAPYARNLRDLLLLQRPLVPEQEPAIGRTPGRRRAWLIAQAGYGTVIVVIALAASLYQWSQYGPGAPRSPLYGIWDVEQMTIDGDVRPPLVTDAERWRRVIMQTPTAVVFQKMDDSFDRYGATFDGDGETLRLIRPAGEAAGAETSALVYQRPSPDQAVMDGIVSGRSVHLELKQRDLRSFVLNSRGFNWVQDVPFNR